MSAQSAARWPRQLRIAEPLRLGTLTLRNRLVATAHATAAVTDGVPTPADAAYWARLARGGASMIVTGGVSVARESTLRNRLLTEAFQQEAVPGMRARAEAIKSGGAVAGIQLCHLGRETLGAGTFLPFVAPSDVRSVREPTGPRVLSTDEVQRVVEDFRLSAAHSVAAGFDVIELHAAHGYLLAQFLSRTANIRDDTYGGTPENRVRLLIEVIEAIRQAVPSALVGVRVSVEGNHESGLDLDDLCELLPIAEERAPFDYLNLTYGVRGHYVRDMATATPPLLPGGGQLRAVVDCPLVLSSGFRSLKSVEQALSSGAADLVGMARPFIADPDLPAKLLAGHPEKVRPCVSCNEDCRTFDPTGLCTVNPELAPPGMDLRPAQPQLLSISVAPPSRRVGRRVAVVGAGPAGLECAVTLATRARTDVVVFERDDDIGGQLRVATAAPHRSGWRRLLEFYRSGLCDLGVRVETEVAASAEDLRRFDEVVWATGAEEQAADTSGDAVPLTSSELLAHYQAALKDCSKLVVLDDGFGWWPTVSCVEAAAAAAVRDITVVTPSPGFAHGIPPESRMQLVERLAGVRLNVVPLTAVTSVDLGKASLRHVLSGDQSTVDADVVAVVGVRRARIPQPLPELTARAIGDCVVPRRVSHAIAEGRHAGLAIARPSAGSAG
jgi:2,4-dienoyl-CoA reductase-like NADH-dependent reductase (Old Yellow Enzyme family)